MTGPKVLPDTYEALNVASGEYVRLRGTVLTNVHVDSGARLEHEGFINEGLYIEAGADVLVRGYARRLEAARTEDVYLEGYGPMPPNRRIVLPFTGPDGLWLLLDEWKNCVLGIEKVLAATGLGKRAASQAKGESPQSDWATLDAFWAASSAIAITNASDRRLWALLGAAVFNDDADLRLGNLDKWGVWSPNDCRKRLPWEVLRRYLTAPPWLFTEVASMTGRVGRTNAKDWNDAVWPLVGAVLDVGEKPPSRAAVSKAEAFRSMLLRQIETTEQPPPRPPIRPKPKPRPRGETKPKTRVKPEVGRKPGARGVAKPESRSTVINASKDPIDTALSKLDGLIGLAAVKKEVRDLAGFARVSRERTRRGYPPTTITRHMVMTGNPGTGKTTVAKLLGDIYYGYGLLKKPDVKSVERRHLVGQYVGHTEKLVEKVFTEAKGGILFIDEAYSLSSTGIERDFGQVVINELVPLIENHRDEIMVIVAGYPDPMKKFLAANEGFAGRFGQSIRFPNYTDAELLQILHYLCEEGPRVRFRLPKATEPACQTVIRGARRQMGGKFDNARMVRRLFETAVKRQHARVGEMSEKELSEASEATMEELTPADIPTAKEVAAVAADDSDNGAESAQWPARRKSQPQRSRPTPVGRRNQ